MNKEKQEKIHVLKVGSIKIVAINNSVNYDNTYWKVYTKHEDKMLAGCFTSNQLMNSLYEIAEYNQIRLTE